MECPDCGAPLPADLDRCPSCGVELREVQDDLARLIQTTDVALLPVLKSVLDAAGIPYLVQGDEALSLLPIGPLGGGASGRRSMGAIVHVPKDRLEEALDLLASVTPPPEEASGPAS